MLRLKVALTAGIVLASLLFMREVAEMTRIADITDNHRYVQRKLAPGGRVFRISGPLFFAAADRIFGELSLLCENQKGIVLVMDGVPLLDAGGLTALNKLVSKCSKSDTRLVIADLQFQPLKTLARAGVKPLAGVSSFHSTLAEALAESPSFKDEADGG